MQSVLWSVLKLNGVQARFSGMRLRGQGGISRSVDEFGDLRARCLNLNQFVFRIPRDFIRGKKHGFIPGIGSNRDGQAVAISGHQNQERLKLNSATQDMTRKPRIHSVRIACDQILFTAHAVALVHAQNNPEITAEIAAIALQRMDFGWTGLFHHVAAFIGLAPNGGRSTRQNHRIFPQVNFVRFDFMGKKPEPFPVN